MALLGAVTLLPRLGTMKPPFDAGSQVGDPGMANVLGSSVRAKLDHHATAWRARAFCEALKAVNTGCATEALGPEFVPSYK